jgi:hypothetical protein
MGIAFAAGGVATSQAGARKKIAIMFVNNAKTTYDAELNSANGRNFDQLFAAKYEMLPGGKYIELLNKVGIVDVAAAERADIMAVVKGEDLDYILYAELQPFLRKEKITAFTYGIEMTAIMPIKIIDVKQNGYVYNGKFTEIAKDSSAVGGIGNKSVALKALRHTLEKINAVVSERMP